MDDYSKKLLLDRIILRTVYTLIPFGVLGVGLIVWSKFAERWNEPIRSDVFREIGVALLVTAALTVMWDLIAKRAFTDEVLAKANMSRDLAEAGIRMVTPSFMDGRISWSDLFKCSSKLDIWVSYASTWRNSHAQEIEKMLSKKGALLRVVMPDPSDQQILGALAARYETTAESVATHVQEAIDGFSKFNKNKNVEIYLATVLPIFTIYLFSSVAMIALYNHRKGRLPVPTLLCDEDGYLFQYLTEEFEGIVANAKKHTDDASNV